MTSHRRNCALALSVAVVAGCSIFQDQTPERVSFRMSGPAGQTVDVIYSKQFVAGVNETGTTVVEVFGSDTVTHRLPIDTIINIAVEQRFFVQVTTADTVAVNVRVEIDGRRVLDNAGGIFPGFPWRYVYQYNHAFTDLVEVII